MDEANNISVKTDTEVTDINEYLVKFKKPYTFEGQTYNEIDLSKIEDISTKDMIEVDKLFYATGNVAPSTEMSLAYACIVASKVINKPLEFFNKLPGNEGIKVKTVVVNFLFN